MGTPRSSRHVVTRSRRGAACASGCVAVRQASCSMLPSQPAPLTPRSALALLPPRKSALVSAPEPLRRELPLSKTEPDRFERSSAR